MGADRAILVESDGPVDPLSIARIFKTIIDRDGIDLVLLGKQAIDNDNSQTPQMLAAIWGRPQATFASQIETNGDSATVTREVDAGLEKIEIDLPAVISVDLRLNEPRYVKLPDIMKAKKKPFETLAIADLGVDISPQFETVTFDTPEVRQKGQMVDDVAGLIGALKDKGFSL